MLLSDRDILAEIKAGRVACEPFHEAMIQPSSVDVRLDKYFRVFENHKYSVIDPSIEQSELTREVIAEGDEAFILHPGEFVLAPMKLLLCQMTSQDGWKVNLLWAA